MGDHKDCEINRLNTPIYYDKSALISLYKSNSLLVLVISTYLEESNYER